VEDKWSGDIYPEGGWKISGPGTLILRVGAG